MLEGAFTRDPRGSGKVKVLMISEKHANAVSIALYSLRVAGVGAVGAAVFSLWTCCVHPAIVPVQVFLGAEALAARRTRKDYRLGIQGNYQRETISDKNHGKITGNYQR